MKRIPFDSLCLHVITQELQLWVGAKVQKVILPNPLEVWLQIYKGRTTWLVLSADPVFARVYLTDAKAPPKMEVAGHLQQELRHRIEGLTLDRAKQKGFDRILELQLSRADQKAILIAELMGKHSNLFLMQDGLIRSAAKWLTPQQSRRPVGPNRPYNPPPLALRPSLLQAREGDEWTDFEGASPFLVEWIKEHGFETFQQIVTQGDWQPGYVPERGAYPLPIDHSIATNTLSEAIEKGLTPLIASTQFEAARQQLTTQLERVKLSREVALAQLEQALDSAARAREIQEEGELILAYQGQIKPGDTALVVPNYQGDLVTIKLNPEASPMENAERRFKKAKKAKSGADDARHQRDRIEEALEELDKSLNNIQLATSLNDVLEEREFAKHKRWLVEQILPTTAKEDRPFEGHSIRELTSPAGWRVLYGENATSNDYLTTRVAKPNDYWLHVRGGPSAHVVLCTQNHPEKVQKPDLMFAAEIAVRNSSQKHSRHVPVDYCLKKYVRKPRGSAPGMASYHNEKTLSIDAVPGLA